jgi:hypothetical protein
MVGNHALNEVWENNLALNSPGIYGGKLDRQCFQCKQRRCWTSARTGPVPMFSAWEMSEALTPLSSFGSV